MSTVLNSHQLIRVGKKTQNERQRYHHNPLADEESMEDDYESQEDLSGFTDYTGKNETVAGPMKGFVSASSVLNKYETKELEQGSKGGFVTFKTRTFDEPTQEDLAAKRQRAVSIPEHLRRGMPDPLEAHKKTSYDAAKSSSAYASESGRLKAELAELEKQKEATLAKMGGSGNALSSRSSSKPLPTPSLTFK